MSVKKTQGCPFCAAPIPAGGEHVCKDPTKAFMTAHACHEDTQQLVGAYDKLPGGPTDPNNPHLIRGD